MECSEAWQNHFKIHGGKGQNPRVWLFVQVGKKVKIKIKINNRRKIKSNGPKTNSTSTVLIVKSCDSEKA